MKEKAGLLLLVLIALSILFLFDYTSEKIQPVELSELQALACTAADEAGTCDSRLPEVGIVLSADCCQALGKCCSAGVQN